MTSKLQPSTGSGTVNREDLGTRLSCFGRDKKWRTFHSFQEEELQLKLGEIIAERMAKTVRRQLGGRHLLFGEYFQSWTNLDVQYRR